MSFSNPEELFMDLGPSDVARLLAVSADVAVVLDRGIVGDVSINLPELSSEDYPGQWIGRPWVECVTDESRPKIQELLARADEAASGRETTTNPWRQVNHPSSTGLDLPVSYATIAGPDRERLYAVGREQRTISLIQQRLIDAHQSVERVYTRLRAAEARYTSLFRSIATPVLIVDPETRSVTDANPAAGRALAIEASELEARPFEQCFHEGSADVVQKLVSDVSNDGIAASVEARTTGGDPCRLAASLFRDTETEKIVVSVLRAYETAEGAGEGLEPPSLYSPRQQLVSILQELPDGLVVIGPDLRVLAANGAFKDLLGVGRRSSEIGIWLPDHVGRSTTELNVLVSNLKSHGSVRNFLTVVRDVFGREEEVEISAVAAEFSELGGRGGPAYGLAVRSVARRLRGEPSLDEALPRSVDQLTGLVGRVPLKQIVQETTDFIERLCIEAALEVTRDNRASAAEMLGLSRQALYTKLKRFGLDR